MNIFQGIFSVAAIISTILFTTSCAEVLDQNQTSTPEQKLTIGILPDVDSVPFLIAQQKGFYNDEKIAVEIKQFKSAPERDAAFQTGNLDAVVSDMLAAEFLQAGGFEVESIMSTDGNYCLVVGNGNDPDEIAGKDIAVSKNTIIEYVTDKILEHGGINPNEVNKVIIPQIPVRLEMLSNGKLFAAALPEPMASIAIANGCTLVGSANELQINPGIFLATKKSATEKKSEFEKLFRAYNRAVEYLNTTPKDQYIDDVIQLSGFPEQSKETLSLPKYREATMPFEKDRVDVKNWLADRHE